MFVVVLGVDVPGGSFGGRLLCSCALKVELNPIVISETTKIIFILDAPSFTSEIQARGL